MVAYGVTGDGEGFKDILSAFKSCIPNVALTQVLTNIKEGEMGSLEIAELHHTKLAPLQLDDSLLGMFNTTLKHLSRIMQQGHRFLDVVKHL